MPSDAFEELFDRDRLLGGIPAKRASTLLFLIESRTARLTARSRQAMARFATRDAVQARELAFIEAFALGREPPLRPTIQDLELQAPRWASLVARNPRVQAALAHRFGEKYRLVRSRVRATAAALGLDDPLVAEAFEDLYGQPLDSIYVDRPTLGERLRWRRAQMSSALEGMSPFWTAYALTLTETVGSTIVALPIAVAAVGPLPAAAILIALGIVNVVTVAYMSDALTRCSTIRFGDAYIGRVVTDLLGRPGALVLSAGVIGICVMGMQADYIGTSVTLRDVTGIPAVGWVAALFAIELLYLRRGSIDATVSTALVVGAINITLILVICALAFVHADPANLTRVELPFVGDEAFDRTTLALIFGVTFTAYFGHLSVSNCARVVLARDPGGRTLLRGVVAAQLTAIVLYVLFVVAVAGAVAPAELVAETGTALSPLADEAGAAVLVLGGVLVILGMGMASIHSAFALFYLVRERLPSRAPLTLVLPRRGAQIVLESRRRRDRLHVAMTYVGTTRGTAARFRIDVAPPGGGPLRSVEATAAAQWEPFADAALRELGLREQGHVLRMRILSATDHEVRAELSTSLRMRYEGAYDRAGVSLAGILELGDREAAVLAHVLRRSGSSTEQVATATGIEPAAAAALLDALVARGLVSETRTGGERRFVARAGQRRGGRLSAQVWDALKGEDDEPPAPSPPATAGRARHLLSGERARFLAGISPVALMFAFAAWQATAGTISLADVLSFLGVIIVALLAGVFPVLLLVAARNKGELVPGERHLPAGRVTMTVVYVVAVGGVAAHGLYLWEDPFQRACAIAITLLALAMTFRMARGETFAPRATIELRQDVEDDEAQLSLVTAGRPATAEVLLAYVDGSERRLRDGDVIPRFASLRSVTVTPSWQAPRPAEVKVWAHRITDEDESEPIAARLRSHAAGEPHEVSLDGTGEAIVALDAGTPQVVVTLRD
jgi:amino acid permease